MIIVCWLLACFTSKQHTSIPQGRICSDNFTCGHTETEVANQTFCLTQPKYTDAWSTGPNADPMTPGVWHGGHCRCQFLSHWYDSAQKNNRGTGANRTPGLKHSRRACLTTRPTTGAQDWKSQLVRIQSPDRLVGLVVKASASRAEDSGFESRLRRDFSGVESYQRLKNWHSSGYPARRLAL